MSLESIETKKYKIKKESEYKTKPGTINLYEIIQDDQERPFLKTIHGYKTEDIVYDEQCGVRFINECFDIYKMANEHVYIMAMNSKWNITGIFNISIGNWKHSNIYKSNIISFLVLVGAKEFVMYHNHPNGIIEASSDDITTAITMYTIANMMDIEFEGSFIVGKNDYCIIK